MISDQWQLLSIIAGLLAAWGVLLMGVIYWMFRKNEKYIDKKLSCIDKIINDNQSLERQLLQLKADLPLNYVRKEDFIRHEVVINTKLDRLRDLIEKCFRTGGIIKNGE